MADYVPVGPCHEELMRELALLRLKIGADTAACLFHKDRDGRMVWVNDECSQFFGRPRTDILGRTDFDLFPALLARKYRDDDCCVMSEGKPFRSYEKVNRADGGAHFVYVVKIPHRDAEGNINGVLGAFWASAPQSDVELHLHESEVRLRGIIDHLPVMVCALDSRGRFVYGNRECERLTGYRLAEIIENPLGLSLLFPDDASRIAINEPGHFNGDVPPNRELILAHKDGSLRTLAWTNVGAGRPVSGWGSWGIGVDVTERNQATGMLEAIRAVQDDYIAKAAPEALFEQSLAQLLSVTQSEFGFIGEIVQPPDGPVFLRTRVITSVSTDEPMRAFHEKYAKRGFEFHDLEATFGPALASGRPVVFNDPGHDLRRGQLPEDFPPLRTFLGAPLNHDRRLIGLAGIANRPGGYRPKLVAAIAPFLSTIASMIYYHQVDRERQRLEAQFQYTQKLESLGVLAGGIAHDFNNLLVTILGHASLANEDLPLTSSARESVKQIETAAIRAADLCKQMLAYSGKGHFVVRRLNLSDIVQEMSHLMQVSISKKIVLRQNLVKDMASIEADAGQIRQVLMNLITNSSEACGEASGLITISTGMMRLDREYLSTTFLDEALSIGNYVYLEVSDTGCGMDEATRSRIFDPFFTTKSLGRGLGLAAILGIVRGHRGAIKCYSEPGRGTTFKVLFPVVAGEPEPMREKKVTSTARAHGTILVVDDEDGVRLLAQRALERVGFKVLIARDGREGVEIYKLFHDEIVLVLLDMTMPELMGDEVFLEMRKIREDVRVVLSSGYNEQEATNRFVGKGLAGFIQKPYRPSDLIELISHVLAPESS